MEFKWIFKGFEDFILRTGTCERPYRPVLLNLINCTALSETRRTHLDPLCVLIRTAMAMHPYVTAWLHPHAANRLFFLCKFMEVKQTVPNLENKFLWMLVYIFNEVMIWMCKIVCMRQLEILTILMDNHFIHETCWYVVLFVGLQFLALALLNVNMAKTVTLAAECYWRWCEMSNYSFKKWVTNEIMVLTRQGYISYVWIVYEFFIWQFCWVAHF